MKQHAKVGNRAGKPAYRTPSSFRNRKAVETDSKKAIGQKHNKAVPYFGTANLPERSNIDRRSVKQ